MSVSERGATRFAEPVRDIPIRRQPVGRPTQLDRAIRARQLRAELRALGVPAARRRSQLLLAARLSGRFVPYANAALLAYELWDIFGDDIMAVRWSPFWNRSNSGVCTTPNFNGNPTIARGYNAAYRCNSAAPHPGYTLGWGQVSHLTDWYGVRVCRAQFGLYRGYADEYYVRAPGAPAGPLPEHTGLPHYRTPFDNPNVVRRLPSVRPAPEPQPQREPEKAAKFDPWQGREFSDGGVRYTNPTRSPPSSGEREPPKSISRSRKLAVMVFRSLDAVSEWAEIVDAAFEALPEKVQKRWKRKSRGLIDSAGQYGIDGADWKLQAIFHNYMSLDVQTFVENIIKNNVEDDIIGAMNRARPRNSVSAFEQSDKVIGKALNEFLDDLVDFDNIW